MDHDGPDGNQTIYFYNTGPTGRSLAWNDAQDRFEMNDELALSGPIRTGGLNASVNYNYFGSGGAPTSGDMASAGDVYVNEDLEVDGQVYLNGEIRMDDNGPDGNQFIYFYNNGNATGDALSWNDGNDRFEFSDDLWVAGTFQAVGAENFVQNHPSRPDLSVVYASLEGDEVATYTRGTARLAGGVARIPLDETFALVTNPDIGLTAHLTPRGQPADLYVESVSPREMVVRASPASAPAIAAAEGAASILGAIPVTLEEEAHDDRQSPVERGPSCLLARVRAGCGWDRPRPGRRRAVAR